MDAHQESTEISELPLVLKPIAYSAVAVLLTTQALLLIGLGYWFITGIAGRLGS